MSASTAMSTSPRTIRRRVISCCDRPRRSRAMLGERHHESRHEEEGRSDWNPGEASEELEDVGRNGRRPAASSSPGRPILNMSDA